MRQTTRLTAIDSYFPAQMRARGKTYYHTGRIKPLRMQHDRLRCIAYGTFPYDVEISWTEATYSIYCSCACYAREMVCKHVYAAFLVAGVLDIPIHHEPRLLPLAEPSDDDLDIDDFSELATRLIDGTHTRMKRREQRSPGWRQVLHELLALRSPPRRHKHGSHEQIIYGLQENTLALRGVTELDLFKRSLRKNGSWGKPRPLRISAADIEVLDERLDRRVLAMLHGADGESSSSHYYSSYNYGSFGRKQGRFVVPDSLADEVLPLLAASGRLFVCAAGNVEPEPCTLDDSQYLLHFELRAASKPKPAAKGRSSQRQKTGGLALTASLRSEHHRLDPTEGLHVSRGGWMLHGKRITRLAESREAAVVELLEERGAVHIPAEDADTTIAMLVESVPPAQLDVPDELRWTEERPAPRARLHVHEPDGSRLLGATLLFEYGQKRARFREPPEAIFDPDSRRMLLRDRNREQAAVASLVEHGFQPRRGDDGMIAPDAFAIAPRQFPGAARELIAQGWAVQADGKLLRAASTYSLRVASGKDWFDLEGSARFDDQELPLPAILRAIRRGESVIMLGDGTVGMLPEEWVARFGRWAAWGEVEGDAIRFRRNQVMVLDALLADHDAVDWDAQAKKARRRLERFERIEPVDAPEGFCGELRPYQRDGLAWMLFLRAIGLGGILADDMGLGKTIQALAYLATHAPAYSRGAARTRPDLVVVPRSLLFNWIDEAARFTPELRTVEHVGNSRQRRAETLADYDVIVTTYGTLRRDIELLSNLAFDTVILDEAQAIKNFATRTAKAVRVLRADHRLALSGTPIENHTGELRSIFEFLNPGMLGPAPKRRGKKRRATNEANGSPGTAPDIAGASTADPELEAEQAFLRKVLGPFILRRTKGRVAKELPARTEQTLFCDLSPRQRSTYEEIRRYYRASLTERIEADGLGRSKVMILEALLRLRQAACHPGLIDGERTAEPSAKLDALLQQLEEVVAEGHKALVFSQFTRFLAIVRSRLDDRGIDYAYLDGRTRKRAERVQRFQSDPHCPLFLISLRAGGLGLNLTAAEYVFLLDPWWNPAVEAQAIDRTHRIGQRRQVMAYRLVARRTVEEKILELQADKRSLADAIIQADGALIRDLRREDIEALLS